MTKDHIQEIFSHYGTVKFVDFPVDRLHTHCRGFCYVEFTTPEEAENAMKHMDGGTLNLNDFLLERNQYHDLQYFMFT